MKNSSSINKMKKLAGIASEAILKAIGREDFIG